MDDIRANPLSATSAEAPPVMAPPARPSRGRWLWLAGALLLLVLLALLFCFNPAEHAFYPFCFFQRVTGLQCPGCGGLRATHHLLHGHVMAAFQYNPLVVMAALFMLFVLVRRWWRGPNQPWSPRSVMGLTWFAFAVVLVFWIVRNLPIDMFKLPGG
jgi:hypothetical protein